MMVIVNLDYVALSSALPVCGVCVCVCVCVQQNYIVTNFFSKIGGIYQAVGRLGFVPATFRSTINMSRIS